MKLENLDSVQNAIAKVESRSSAELVVSVIKQSGNYDHLGVLILSVFLAIGMVLGIEGWLYARFLPFSWNPQSALLMLGSLAIAAAFALSRTGRGMRWFTSLATRERWVNLRAEVEFFEEIFGRTHASTGVLIFVSLAEHRAVILADREVFAKVPKESFDQAMNALMAALRRGHLAEGLVAAVEAVGEKLVGEFPVAAGDVNEVSNHVHVKDD